MNNLSNNSIFIYRNIVVNKKVWTEKKKKNEKCVLNVRLACFSYFPN